MKQFLHHYLTLSLTSFLLFSSCAYFNTFYNAQRYYEKAEKLRLEKVGESIPPTAIDSYGKVIDKSQYIIDHFPDSKYYPDALFLIGKAHYHRREYRIAENSFKQYVEQFDNKELEAKYWQALCKWKLGKPQPALDDLNDILEKTDDKDLPSKIFLSIAEIKLEDKDPKSALINLESAASSNRDRDERGQIYYRLAGLAYNAGDFDRSLKAYHEVLKNTTSKKRKEEASLMIVRINRQLGHWKKVQSLIKTMLIDDVFKPIHGDLEIELVKLYQMDGRLDEAVTRLESIKEDYKNTKTSAEANYIHGKIELFDYWNLDGAKKYFGQVTREFRQSPFISSANLRKKEITEYQESETKIEELEKELTLIYSELDTIKSDSIQSIKNSEIIQKKITIAENLYNLGELEAFHFDRSDSSMKHFKRITDEFTDSDYYPKSLFVLYYLYRERDDTLKANLYSEKILSELPTTEFADYLRKDLDLPVDPGSVQALLRQGELHWLIQPEKALGYYKEIIQKDSASETSARAAYFLAYHYDYTFFNPDSALKYYSWLQKYYPKSEQTKASTKQYISLSQWAEGIKKDTMNIQENDDIINIDSSMVKTRQDSLDH